jgi:hypothetical protein
MALIEEGRGQEKVMWGGEMRSAVCGMRATLMVVGLLTVLCLFALFSVGFLGSVCIAKGQRGTICF